jgi:hypothetical protein
MVGMSDERFEAWLREAAKEYNRPPDIAPRQEMWENIELKAQRAKRKGMPVGFGPRRSMLGAPWWSVAAAAALFLAVGIGLGYWVRGGQPVSQTVAQPDTTPRVVARAPLTTNSDSSTISLPSAPSAQRSALPAPRSETAGSEATVTGYDVLATETLTAAEALLVSFRTSEDTALDDLMRRWSRELLSTTRLLMESPAAKDVQRRRLLEDLELVLVQLAQLPATDAAFDREIVKRAIARRQVLTRIRTAIPAGRSSGS